MVNKDAELIDFAVTARKYKTLLTKKYVNRKMWVPPVIGEIKAVLPGTVISLNVQVGDELKQGDLVLIQEAMKMRNRICAPVSGTVKEIRVNPGERVAKADIMIVIE